jgi:hypothetical protein
MATKKEVIGTVSEDLFAGLLSEETTSSMTVWSKTLQTELEKEPSVKFAEGKRAEALEAVFKFLSRQELNPIVRYVAIMGLRTLNRKVGK